MTDNTLDDSGRMLDLPNPLVSRATRSRTLSSESVKPAPDRRITPSNNPWRKWEQPPKMLGKRTTRSQSRDPAGGMNVDVDEGIGMEAIVEKVTWPKQVDLITPKLVHDLVQSLRTCGYDHHLLRKVLTFPNLSRLLRQTEKLLGTYPNVIPVALQEDVQLCIVGDTHGQFYDVLHLFETEGYPSEKKWYLFNGGKQSER